MIFRDAQPMDARALKALHMESWRTAYSAFAPEDLFGEPLKADMNQRWDDWPEDRMIRVVEAKAEICAFAAVEFKPFPYLDNLHVAPNLKRQGMGRLLMADLARCLLDQGHDSLSLTVINGNARARGFYAACHGTEREVRPDKLLGHPISVVPVDWDADSLKTLKGSIADRGKSRAKQFRGFCPS